MKNAPKTLRKLQTVVLLGLVLLAGPAFYSHRAGWLTPIYRYIDRTRWHRAEIIRAHIVFGTDRSSPLAPPKRTCFNFSIEVRHPGEKLPGCYYIESFDSTPAITLNGKALSLDELIAAVTKYPVEVIRRTDHLCFSMDQPSPWFEDKVMYIRRDGIRLLAIRISTDARLPERRSTR
jgi:hypothetical protein